MQKRKSRKLINKVALQKYENYFINELTEEWRKIEHQAKKEEVIRKTREVGMKIGRVILALALIGGVLAVGAVAPNVFGVVGRRVKRRGFFGRREFLRTKDYLRKQGYIELLPTKKEGEYLLHLTEKGRDRILRDQIKRKVIQSDINEWDGYWRIVLFDIPEKNKSTRETLREKLRTMGLYKLQDSVFVSPFPIQAEIEMFCEIFSIASGVRCIESKNIGEDEDIRSFFRLSK